MCCPLIIYICWFIHQGNKYADMLSFFLSKLTIQINKQDSTLDGYTNCFLAVKSNSPVFFCLNWTRFQLNMNWTCCFVIFFIWKKLKIANTLNSTEHELNTASKCLTAISKWYFQGEKYKDEEPNAIDLFKECHYNNKKNGYTPQVQSAIVR